MGKRLLLADDSITIQKVIGITFANEDFDLDIVDNGDAALERARADRPDIILADVYMPGKNGYELCQAIKNDPALCRVPVLLLAGTFEPFDEDKARQAGADAWIAKPFESQALIDKVDELLAQAASAPEPEPVSEPEPVPEPEPVSEPEPVAFAAEVAESTGEEEVVDLGDEDIWVDEADLELIEEDFDLEEPEVTAESEPVVAPEEPGDRVEQPVEPVEEPAVAMDELDAAEEPAVADDDIWGSISFDEDDLSPAEAAVDEPELAATDLVEPEPAAEPESQAVSASDAFATEGEDLWQETEDEIFDLDDVDVIDEEELLAEPEPVAETVAAAEPQPVAAVEPEGMAEPVDHAVDVSDFEWGATDLEATEPEFAVPEAVELAESDETESEIIPEGGAATGVETAAEPFEEPAAFDSAGQVEQQVAALDEAAIEAIVEKVAGRVIEQLAGTVLERIAWEVVPDLAESYIKEELRKIREAV
ncbi:MAG: response regulator [Geothermobacteraceae bacterium]